MSMQFDVLGAVGVRSNRELMRVVRAAVEGRAIRTGRKRCDDSSLCPGLDGLDSDDRPDVDADAGFFDMSPASAEQVTIQIRSMMERAWEYIAIAYQGRAHIALGYATWDEYVDDRLGDLGLTVPRQERGAVVQLLSRAQMSLRAISKVLGVEVATVHRALGGRCRRRPPAARWTPARSTQPARRDGTMPKNQRRSGVVTASSTRADAGRPH